LEHIVHAPHPLQNKNKSTLLNYSWYTGELNFGQTIWDKTQVLLGTSWGTHLGTLWELDGNMTVTHWEQAEKTKNPSLPLPLQKEKNWVVHDCMLSHPIGCMKFLFPKLLITSFGLG